MFPPYLRYNWTVMNKPHELLFKLQNLVSGLAGINRNHYRPGSNIRENDIEHSFSVALLCWAIVTEHKLPLELSKVLIYALTHDFVEFYAGDTNTFATAEERLNKLHREQLALQRFNQEFADFPEMLNSMQLYENKDDPESLFVWTVDKLQPLILGDIDNWRPYVELAINYNSFCKKYEELLSQASPYSKEIFESLIKYSQTTYYDQPKTSQQG